MEPALAAETERRRAELDTLWEHIPAGVVLVESITERVVRMNPAAEQLLASAAAGDVAALESYRAFHRDGRPVAADEWPIARTIATGDSVHGEVIEFELTGGGRRALSITSAPVRERGRIVAAIALIVDVTAEERRERVAREFITNAAHELQTPLAAITSAIEVLQAGAKERRAERDRFLLHIAHATRRLTRLTRALLALAQAQAQLEEPRTEVIALAPLLESIAAQLPEAGVTVVCAPDVAVVANPVLLEQAVFNIVENAQKHAGGPITVTASLDASDATIAVRDRGPGIRAEDKPRVFERFFRRPGAEGFGLGLAIVREVVDILGGTIHIDSGPEGTEVSLKLAGARARTT